jgi:hypothetical protein
MKPEWSFLFGLWFGMICFAVGLKLDDLIEWVCSPGSSKFSGLKYLFQPSWWIQIHPFSAAWDKELNWLIDSYEFERITEYTATIGGLELWTANYPYGSFHPVNMQVRAHRATIERAFQHLIASSIKLAGGVK